MITNVFSTPRDAAIAGLQEAMVLARRDGWEYGGLVLNNGNGTFSYSKIVTKKDPHAVGMEEALPRDFAARINAMQTAVEGLKDDNELNPELKAIGKALDKEISDTITGTFHTHLTHEPWATDWTRYFSGRDVFLATRMEQLSWLGLTDTNEVFELDARTIESAKATAGKTRRAYREENGLGSFMGMLVAFAHDEAPFLVTGTQVYAGHVLQDAQRQAA